VSYPRPAPRVPADPIFYSSLLIDAPTNDRNYVINLSTQHNNKQLITAVTTGCHSNESKRQHGCWHLPNKVEHTDYIPDTPCTLQWAGRSPKKPFPQRWIRAPTIFFQITVELCLFSYLNVSFHTPLWAFLCLPQRLIPFNS